MLNYKITCMKTWLLGFEKLTNSGEIFQTLGVLYVMEFLKYKSQQYRNKSQHKQHRVETINKQQNI